jgi:hypothetical protein
MIIWSSAIISVPKHGHWYTSNALRIRTIYNRCRLVGPGKEIYSGSALPERDPA